MRPTNAVHRSLPNALPFCDRFTTVIRPLPQIVRRRADGDALPLFPAAAHRADIRSFWREWTVDA
jgi:hypothetical protein